MKRIFAAVLLSLLPALLCAQIPSEPGIYARFQTNHGAFTAELFFEQVPMTVANFIGLAEGTRPWIDLESGQLRSDPFYDGLTFHRVIAGFMIQGGSRNGNGTDGPGYRFPDEFVPGLVHDEKGVLSMANSGPDTNGSQFFITVAPTEWLNYQHSVFGKIVEGMEIVEAISTVAVASESNKPLEPVIVESVEIHRVGTEANAFDVNAARGLPDLNPIRPNFTATSGSYSLQFPRKQQNDYILSYSNDLKTWTPAWLPAAEVSPGIGRFDVTGLAAEEKRQFYRLTEVDYFLPDNLVGRTLQLNLSTTEIIVLQITDERTAENQGQPLGTGTFDGTVRPLTDYIYYEQNRRGYFSFLLQGLVVIHTELKFATPNSGTFTGQAMAPPPFDIHGTFTLLP